MKIVKLDINPDIDLAGVDAVALVERPAIEEEFIYFSKEEFAETFNDYPESAVEAAKQGIKRNEENNNKCATQVGKVRAQQLANRENLSLDTVRRMRSYLLRAEALFEKAQAEKNYDACSYISYLLWGGPSALPWAEKKLRQAGEEFTTDEDIIEELIKQEMDKIKSIGDKIQHLTTGKSTVDTVSDSNVVVDNSMVFSQKKTIYLIACSSTKLNYECKAKDLYDSPLFDKSINYAYSKGATDKDIKILSGKYGLVDMNTVIKPYDVYLGDKSAEQKKEWAEGVFEVLNRRYDLDTTKFIFLAGNDYSQYLEEMLPKSKDVLEGKKVGERLQYLDKFDALDDQQIVIGPLMKPNMLIPRLDENGDPYHVYFTADTIKKIAYKMIKDKLIDRVNIEHDNMESVDAYLVESWIIDGANDKSKNYGFNLPEGTWMGMYKIQDKKIWDEYIKSGLVKGFSVEGMFNKFAQQACKVGKTCACGLSESGMCDGSHNK
tara:strand:+ start:1733 stop:3205 length:1473 start_codon:yes stop_codon:yes gene_type:complete